MKKAIFLCMLCLLAALPSACFRVGVQLSTSSAATNEMEEFASPGVDPFAVPFSTNGLTGGVYTVHPGMESFVGEGETGGVAEAPKNGLAVWAGGRIFYISGHKLTLGEDGLYSKDSYLAFADVADTLKTVPYSEDFALYVNGQLADTDGNRVAEEWISSYKLYDKNGTLLTHGTPLLSDQFTSLRAIPPGVEGDIVVEAVIKLKEGSTDVGYQYFFKVDGAPRYLPGEFEKYKPAFLGRLNAAEVGYCPWLSGMYPGIPFVFETPGLEIELSVSTGEICYFTPAAGSSQGRVCYFESGEKDSVYWGPGLDPHDTLITYMVYENGKLKASGIIEMKFQSNDGMFVTYSAELVKLTGYF